MSEVKKIATRDSYGKELIELAKVNDKVVVLDADLAAATRTGWFKKEFPDRHIDCGIAECNMMGIAAGYRIFFLRVKHQIGILCQLVRKSTQLLGPLRVGETAVENLV